jgi:hypothetical protein
MCDESRASHLRCGDFGAGFRAVRRLIAASFWCFNWLPPPFQGYWRAQRWRTRWDRQLRRFIAASLWCVGQLIPPPIRLRGDLSSRGLTRRGLRAPWFHNSITLFQGAFLLRQLWWARYHGWGMLFSSCRGGPTPIYWSGLQDRASACGGGRSPVVLRQRAQLWSVDVWLCYRPQAVHRGLITGGNRFNGRDLLRIASTRGVYTADFGGSSPISPAVDRLLGNSVGAIESVACRLSATRLGCSRLGVLRRSLANW